MKKQNLKKVLLGLSLGLVLCLSSGLAQQSQSTQQVTFNVNLLEWYNLSLDKNTLTFNDVAPQYVSNPSTTEISAAEGPLQVTVFAVVIPSQPVKLTITANGDLTDGSNIIPASAISWTASGNGFASGTLENGTAVEAGSWTGIFTYQEGTMNFSFLRDYVNQVPGNYTMTATFTLSKV
ncbi:MAG: hypothetical protein H5U07_00470 [Candidatus Aminicenantes bacterium]|nr:hypothetical protein [Candidatus Aminicenantes bacterium]